MMKTPVFLSLLCSPFTYSLQTARQKFLALQLHESWESGYVVYTESTKELTLFLKDDAGSNGVY